MFLDIPFFEATSYNLEKEKINLVI